MNSSKSKDSVSVQERQKAKELSFEKQIENEEIQLLRVMAMSELGFGSANQCGSETRRRLY
jgi:hypothetical protein